MKMHSRPVKSRQLGLVGEEHLRVRFEAHGCAPKSFNYTKVLGKDGLPKVAEIAFGALKDQQSRSRRLVTGVNWSPGINDPFRSLGKAGESAKAHLAGLWASNDEPIIVFMHLACPRMRYTDRGKSAVVVS